MDDIGAQYPREEMAQIKNITVGGDIDNLNVPTIFVTLSLLHGETQMRLPIYSNTGEGLVIANALLTASPNIMNLKGRCVAVMMADRHLVRSVEHLL